MSLADYIPAKYIELFSDPDFLKVIKGYNLYLLKEDKEYRKEIKTVLREELDTSFNARLATSELRPIKRIAKLEQVTGLDDFGLDDEHEPTIPERIESLENKLSSLECRPSEKPTVEFKTETKTEHRASLLVEELTASGKEYMSTKEIINFLKCKLPESCKIDDSVQNIRKVKQDVLSKAASMYQNVFLSKKRTGHREVRLVLGS